MSDSKTTNVYYYQLLPIENGLEPAVKNQIFKICDKEIFQPLDRYVRIDHADGFVNLYDREERLGRYIFGTFVYNQTTNIPPVYNEVENKPSQLKIGAFDGLGFDSSFVYDQKTRIIGLESKKPGTSLKCVTDFIRKNFNISDLDFKMVVLPDEYKKFLEATDYKRLEIDLAIPNNDMGILKPNEKNAANLLDLMQNLKGTSAKLIISNGRSRKKNLSIDNVRQLAQWFKKNEKGEDIAKSFKITGVDIDSDSNHVFDIISNRLITDLTVAKIRTIGNFQIKSKYDQLEGDFLRYREQLELLQT
ncbi:MAG: DUF6731 family protein [Bacteroidota bacterium]